MRSILWMIIILLAHPAMARDYTYEIRQAQQACAVEQFSILSESNGTPSCQRVQDLIALQRLAVEAEVARETGQPMPDHTTIEIDNSSRSTYINQPPKLIYNPVTQGWCWSYNGSQCY